MISKNHNSSALLDYLVEVAKTGNLPNPEELGDWMQNLEIDESGSVESNYYHILSTQILIKKGAYEPTVSDPDITAPPEAEDLPYVSTDIVAPIKECLAYKDWTLFEEIMRILKSQNKLLHPMALPPLLDHCQNQFHLHPLMQQTLGKRSLWLAPMQPQWIWWTEVNSSDLNLISPENQLAWTWLHYRSNDVNLQNAFNILSLKDKKRILELLVSQPRSSDEVIAREVLHSRSTSLQYLATLILLQLNTPEQEEIQNIIAAYCQKNIVAKNGKIHFHSESISVEEKIDSKVIDLFKKENNTKHPLFGIIELFPPEFIFQYLPLTREEIIDKLLVQDDLKDLLQIVINSAANFSRQTNFGEILLLQWIRNYPSGNTTEIALTGLLEKLSYEGTQSTIVALLASDDNQYFMEKMNILISGIDHYVKKDLSIQLTEKIFRLIEYRLSRTDVIHLVEVLPHLQYVLDPRTYGTIVSQWQEVDYRQQKLGEVLWEFRNIMKLRQGILTTIIN